MKKYRLKKVWYNLLLVSIIIFMTYYLIILDIKTIEDLNNSYLLLTILLILIYKLLKKNNIIEDIKKEYNDLKSDSDR